MDKDEALRAKRLAEEKMLKNDFEGAHKIALKAKQLFPELDNISQARRRNKPHDFFMHMNAELHVGGAFCNAVSGQQPSRSASMFNSCNGDHGTLPGFFLGQRLSNLRLTISSLPAKGFRCQPSNLVLHVGFWVHR